MRSTMHRQSRHFLIKGGLLFKKQSPKHDFTRLRAYDLCPFEFYRTAIIYITIPLIVLSLSFIALDSSDIYGCILTKSPMRK